MSKMPLALTLLTGVMTAALAQAQTPANAPMNMNAATFSYSVDTTKIGDLLDKPALRAIFEKYLPDVADSPNIEMGRDRTLPDIVQYAPQVTPDKLAAIDKELKALPRSKYRTYRRWPQR